MTPIRSARALTTLALNQARNLLAQARFEKLPASSIYARTHAAYLCAAARTNVSLLEAGAAIRAEVQQIIDREQHFYDLVVLEKTPERVRVRDRRGHEFEALDLVTNSYNDLEWVDENREALARFVTDAPLSSCISRKIAGVHGVHDRLRRELADFLGYESCVLGTCGYISQISTVFALFHEGDVLFSDELNHSSLVDGCRLSHAAVITFPHRDYDRLAELLARHRSAYNGAGILSDGVFSARGSVVDLDRLVELARRHRCITVVDDTHGVGVLGRNGRGVLDLYSSRPDVLTGGFAKAFGSFGGFAACGGDLHAAIDLLGRQNVNTSFLSPVVAAQALIHLRYYRAHHDPLAEELGSRLRAFNSALAEVGLACYPAPDEHLHPVFCLYRKDELATLEVQRSLIAEGFLPSFFPPPVAPWPTLRFSVHRCLPEPELRRLAGLLGRSQLFVASGGRVGGPPQEPRPPADLRAAARSLARRLPLGKALLGAAP